jgi:hypothetical protein
MPAKRENWKTLPMPGATARLSLERAYSDEQFARISEGFIPRQMENHWFVYFDEPWLYLHRSWTGFCIFKARFEHTGDKHVLAEVWVNRDDSQYKGTSENSDARLLGILLDESAGQPVASQMKQFILSRNRPPQA